MFLPLFSLWFLLILSSSLSLFLLTLSTFFPGACPSHISRIRIETRFSLVFFYGFILAPTQEYYHFVHEEDLASGSGYKVDNLVVVHSGLIEVILILESI